MESQVRRACYLWRAFATKIVPVEGDDSSAGRCVLITDEHPRATSLEALAGLKGCSSRRRVGHGWQRSASMTVRRQWFWAVRDAAEKRPV